MKNNNIDVYLVPLLDEFTTTLEGGLCLGRDKARGAVKVQIARFVYAGNSWFAYIWIAFRPND